MSEYKKYFKQVMSYFADRCEKTISKEGLKLEFKVIKKNLTFDEFQYASEKLVENYKYNTMPRPADFIEQVKDPDSKAIIAVDKVINAVRDFGHTATVYFDDPIIHLVIKNSYGGWDKLCGELKENELKWFRKDFIKYYKAYNNKKINKIPELSSNLDEPEEVFIGNKEKAKKVKKLSSKDVLNKEIKQLIGGKK